MKLLGILILNSLILSNVCTAKTEPTLLISPAEIASKLQETAKQLDAEYSGKELKVVMVMKGAICVTADLIRLLKVPTTLESIKASSYGENGSNRGELKITSFETLHLTDKHVLIVDDIYDTGNTMTNLVHKFQEKKPASLKTLVLLMKKVPHVSDYRPDFVLFEIENHFVVGYGLDYKELYRGLPGIYYFPKL